MQSLCGASELTARGRQLTKQTRGVVAGGDLGTPSATDLRQLRRHDSVLADISQSVDMGITCATRIETNIVERLALGSER